jgi:uncharacterized protein (TIGR03067 family)
MQRRRLRQSKRGWRYGPSQKTGAEAGRSHSPSLTRGQDICSWQVIGDKELAKGTFVLDSDKKPKTIEMTGIDEKKGKSSYGIYRIEQNTLTLCDGDELPKEFSGAGEAGSLQFERAKSK